ncbi:DsrE family protein [Alteromonas sp. H39]|uniref:DsrE family protein n=1 Tax=Alteromonas sp. H39 TaxID=3389876 RepID=UPI0039E15E3B
MGKFRLGSLLLIVFILNGGALADTFQTGPVFESWGRHAPVPGVSLDKSARFAVVFDMAEAAHDGKVDRRIDSLARFINMHMANGVEQKNIRLALVVHGGATLEMLSNGHYKDRLGKDNANIALLSALMNQHVRVIVCGQSAAAHKVSAQMLIPGVEMALSAMTAHAQLQQQGYTVNPF